MEKITLLVANHNCADWVEACLQSIRNQTSDAWECIVCDDASTDRSIEVIEPLAGDQIRLIRNDSNRGYTRTLKRMIDEATTDIVGIVDADDALYPEAVEQILKAYDDPSVGFVYSNYQAFDETLAMPIDHRGCRAVPEGKTALVYGFVSHLKTFRKSFYDQTDGYDERIFAEDRDLVYKMEEVSSLRFVDQKLYKHRVLPGSASRERSKLAEGFLSHLAARRNALRRRGVAGFNRWIHAAINASLWAHRYRWTRPLGKCFFNGLCGAVRMTDHSSGHHAAATAGRP